MGNEGFLGIGFLLGGGGMMKIFWNYALMVVP